VKKINLGNYRYLNAIVSNFIKNEKIVKLFPDGCVLIVGDNKKTELHNKTLLYLMKINGIKIRDNLNIGNNISLKEPRNVKLWEGNNNNLAKYESEKRDRSLGFGFTNTGNNNNNNISHSSGRSRRSSRSGSSRSSRSSRSGRSSRSSRSTNRMSQRSENFGFGNLH
jgi:hypothetical protein